ncbi:MAG: hypothetical protein FJ255_12800 [Phycisphaerae bacterium]|nr:hypothetical protein [Phycisphaerae bacterium]
MSTRHSIRCRPGTAYVFLLGTALIVTAAGFAAVEASMSEVANHRLRAAADEARLLAQTGLEVAMARIAGDPSWATSLGAGGTIVSNEAVGRGTITVVVTDPVDSDPAVGDFDPFLLRSSATVGSAVRIAEVELQRRWTPLPATQTAVHAAGGVTFNNGTGITADRAVSSNTGASATSASIGAPVEVVTSASGSMYSGGLVEGVPAKTMPAGVIAQYAALATTITRGSLSAGNINRRLLSPAVNPYNASLNALGIYVIDLGNNDMEIKSSRIFGTLVIRNAGIVKLKEGLVWEPAFVGLPSLLVEGQLWIEGNTDNLIEGMVGRNLNPASTPYKGASNSVPADTYPSRLEGLFYATGPITVKQPRPALTGTLVSGAGVLFEDAYSVTYDTRVEQWPAPGFRTGPEYVMTPGSWKRIVP